MRSVFAALVGASLCVGCSPPELHLIPSGYKGDVAILTGYPAGAPARRERLSILFEVPADGILVTQDHTSSKWHFTRYYYVGGDGRRERIQQYPSTVHDTPENRSDYSPVVALRTGDGEARGIDLPCPIFYTTYYVGTRAHLLARTTDEANARMLSVQKLVEDKHLCR